MSKPTVGSLFTGIGGFDLGLERAGFDVAWQVEIDEKCNKVLAAHWPEVRRYGDVRDVPDALGERGRNSDTNPARLAPDLICGGFPCQDLSVAGKRAGLDGSRSGLWFEFHRILSELRPTFALIENVPGLLSSNQGRDFGIVLAGLGELWPAVGWAVLDSQHFGVAQRRRRVYVVAGPSRACVQQVLSLCEGGDWHPQTRRETREGIAPTLNGGANRTGGDRPPGTQVDTAESLVLANTLPGHHPRQDLDNDTYVTAYGGNRTSGSIDVAAALNAHGGSGRSDFESETFITYSLRAQRTARATSSSVTPSRCPSSSTSAAASSRF